MSDYDLVAVDRGCPPATSVLRSLAFGRIAGTNIARELAASAAATG